MKDYQRIFVETYGPWPHACFFCGEEIDGHTIPCDSTAAVVHHRDHDRSNHESSNLAPAHHGCHSTYHDTGRQGTLEFRAKISTAAKASHYGERLNTPAARAKAIASSRKRWASAEFRAEVQARNRRVWSGRKHRKETREKMSAARTGMKMARVCCVHCRLELGVNNLRAHLRCCS